MMSFIKNQKVDAVKGDVRVHQALIEDLCCANYDHILSENGFPSFTGPEIGAHVTTEATNLLIKVVLEYRRLLKCKCHTVHLLKG